MKIIELKIRCTLIKIEIVQIRKQLLALNCIEISIIYNSNIVITVMRECVLLSYL